MVLYVVAVGRMKQSGMRDTSLQYQRRIERYLRFELREVPDAGRRDRQAADARRIEAHSLLKAIPSDGSVVALTRNGAAETTAGLAARLDRWQQDRRDPVFVVGGAHGLDQSVLDRADYTLSLSTFTLPHDLARIVLLEQLYRACSILRGEPYHKGARV